MFFLDAFLKGLKPNFNDDSVDRVNYYYLPLILIIFALTLSAKQYVYAILSHYTRKWGLGKIVSWLQGISDKRPIIGAWEQYSENYCFVQNTYFLPLDHYIPRDLQEREDREIGYYQWVPFILGIQGILFYLPCLIWQLLNWQSGIAVKGIVVMSQDVSNMQSEKRKDSVEVVASHIYDSLRAQRKLSRRGPIASFLQKGSYLTFLYMIVKFTYFVQALSQFLLLNKFLGTSYTYFWGFEILRDLVNGREWPESGHFPRVTMCDFDVRVLGNKHRHTVQCVLMINMFNEKVFLIVWFLIIGVVFVNIFSWIYWFSVSFCKSQQYSFIARYLRVYGLLDGQVHNALDCFVRRCLRKDGIFILRIISTNAGDLITTDIVAALWKKFLEDEKMRALPPPALSVSAPPVPEKPLSELDEEGFHENHLHDDREQLM